MTVFRTLMGIGPCMIGVPAALALGLLSRLMISCRAERRSGFRAQRRSPGLYSSITSLWDF
jgi:hypothetical protein